MCWYALAADAAVRSMCMCSICYRAVQALNRIIRVAKSLMAPPPFLHVMRSSCPQWTTVASFAASRASRMPLDRHHSIHFTHLR